MSAFYTDYRSGKRRQVILVILGTALVLVGLWFGLIRPQQRSLAKLAASMEASQRKLDTVRKTVAGAQKLEEELAAASAYLAKLEENMATGDYYSWVINQIRQFKLGYRVDIPQFGTIVGPADMPVLPNFPYKQVTLSVGGTGYFHDIGRFIADYENEFPYSRIQNLELEPAAASSGVDKEKLQFRMEIVTLVRPGPRS